LPATCAMGTPSSRAKRRTEGEAWEVPDADADADGGWAVATGATAAAPALGTGAGVCSGAGAAAGAAGAGAGAGAGATAALDSGITGAAAGAGAAVGAATDAATGAGSDAGAAAVALAVATTSISPMRVPWLTLSPSLRYSSLSTPPCAAGTSMEAFSDSMVIRLCSTLMVSPTFTSSSITAASVTSPMSGTVNSMFAIERLLQAYSGLILSASMPYWAMAWATCSGATLPSSASALSVATTM